MNVVENLKPDVQKYLRLRKVLRTIEFVCFVALLVVLAFSDIKDFVEIISCMAVVVIIPEAFLAIQRWTVETSIRCAKLLVEKDLNFYSKQKAEAEKLEEDLISRESDPNLTAESLEFLQEVKFGDDWLSGRIRYFKFLCDELEKNLKLINDLKGLVNY